MRKNLARARRAGALRAGARIPSGAWRAGARRARADARVFSAAAGSDMDGRKFLKTLVGKGMNGAKV